MKLATLLLTLLLFIQETYGQKPAVNPHSEIDKYALAIPDSNTTTTDSIAAYINRNFSSDNDKVRATWIWLATNIAYDIENMFAINFYEKREEKIAKPLATKKGICENYAVLFEDICTKVGIKSYVITGYTKQNGFTDYIPHAWSAALVDSSWYLFDATWGSGYIKDEKFYKKIDNSYYKVLPSKLIKSHMPFDYMWQFLNYPVTNQEFYEGKTQENTSKPYFNYVDSIAALENKNKLDQLKASAWRIEKNGMKNSMIFDRLQHVKMEIQNYNTDLYNSSIADFNSGVNKLNDFIKYRNKQFTPAKTDAQIKKMLADADEKFKITKSKLSEIKEPDGNLKSMLTEFTKGVDDAVVQLKEQQQFLKEYLSKSKVARKMMFYSR